MKISFNCTDDQQVVHTHKDAGLSDQVPCSKPDISPEAYLNDYRNRMPFHYIEEGSDGYYYWQYGSIMDLVINFVDEIAQSEDMPEAVLDVRINDKSVVDPVAGIAHLGSMAMRSTADYYTLQQTDKIVGTLSKQIKDLQEGGIASIVDAPESLMSGQLLMWDSEARRLVGSPLVKGDAEKSIILKTSSSDPNFALHEGAVLLGKGLVSSFPYQFLAGYYNEPNQEELFSVGAGFSDTTRRTAFSISRSGQVRVFTTPLEEQDVARLREINSLQADLAKKLDKVTERTLNSQVYSKGIDGSQLMIDYTHLPVGGSLVQRKADGHIMLPDSDPVIGTDAAPKQYVDSKFELDAVFHKNLTVQGSLTVAGTSTVIDSETLSVRDNFILTNSNQVSLINLSGLVINKDNVSAYGIVLDPQDELLKLGLGKVEEDGTFSFLPGEAQALATRDYADARLRGLGFNSIQQEGSQALGYNSVSIITGDAYGDYSFAALGKSYGRYSFVFGNGSIAGMPASYFNSRYGSTPSEKSNPTFVPTILDESGYDQQEYRAWSVSFGRDNIVYGKKSFSAGDTNRVYGDNSAAFNSNNTVYSNNSFVTGNSNSLLESSDFSFVAGFANKDISGSYNIVAGASNKLSARASAVFGHSNAVYGLLDSPQVTSAGSLVSGVSNSLYGHRSAIFGYFNSVGMANKSKVDAGTMDSARGIITDTFVAGRNHTVNPTYGGSGTVFGSYNTVSGNGVDNYFVAGTNNTISSDGVKYAAIFGKGNKANRSGQFIVGQFSNPTYTSLFVAGNGSSSSDTSNAFEVLFDGRARVQSAPQGETDVVRKQELDLSWSSFNLESGEGSGSIQQKSFIYQGQDIVFSDGTKGTQDGDEIPGAIASGLGSVAFGGLRYDYYTSPETHNYNLSIEPTSTENWGRTPTSAEGNQSFAVGGSSHAYGDWSVALGKDNAAYQRSTFVAGSGNRAGMTYEEWLELNPGKSLKDYLSSFSNAIALGEGSIAKGRSSLAMGGSCTAIGENSVALGRVTESVGASSLSIGMSTKAIGDRSLAGGHTTEAVGDDSISYGYKTKSNGQYSISLGNASISDKSFSLSFGQSAKSLHSFSIAIGDYVTTSADNQFVYGRLNKDNGQALFILGNGYWGDTTLGTTTTRQNAFEVLRDGRAKVQTAPAEDNDVVRLIELSNYYTTENADNAFIHKSTRTANSNKTLYTLCDITSQDNPDWLMANTNGTFGLAKVSSSGGWTLSIQGAAKAELEAQTHNYKPIVPSQLSNAVVVGLTANKNTLTDEQKLSASNWLGFVQRYTGASGHTRVYGYDGYRKNEVTIVAGPTGTAGHIPLYVNETGDDSVRGKLVTGTPDKPYQAANKKYVDDLLLQLLKLVEGLTEEQITALNAFAKTLTVSEA